MSNEKVSIIMPCYNSASFIADSIESVLNQSYVNWELIVVDDCSSDNSQEIIASFLMDKRIKLVSNDSNLGGAGSRNVAIENATGRYIAFLDSDDIWVSNKLEKQISYMQDNSIGFSYSSYQQFDSSGLGTKIIAPKKVSYEQLLKSNFIGCLTVIYDTSFFGKFFFPNTKKRHDFALWLNMLKKFDYAYNASNVSLAYYRVHSSSLSSKKSDAFQSYFYVLNSLNRLSYIRSFKYSIIFTLLSFYKKKNLSLYKRATILLIKDIEFYPE